VARSQNAHLVIVPIRGGVTLGAYATEISDATAGTSVTVSASASVGGIIFEGKMTLFDTPTKPVIDSQNAQLEQAQLALSSMATDTELATGA
jgi:hypothetical protein